MSDGSKYYKLSALTDDWLHDNDLTEHYFDKALKWGIRALEEIRLDVAGDVKTKLLTVTDRKTVVLPDDYADYVKVGVPRGQYVITMGVNDDLRVDARDAGRTDTVAGLLSQHLPNGTDMTPYGGYYFFNYGGSSLYGVGMGLPSKGYFKFHDNGTCKELLLDYDYKFTQIYLEYITNGFDPCGETHVHPYLKDYVLKFIEFEWEKRNNPKANESSIQRKGRDLFHAERNVRARRNTLTPKDMLNITRANFRLTTKA